MRLTHPIVATAIVVFAGLFMACDGDDRAPAPTFTVETATPAQVPGTPSALPSATVTPPPEPSLTPAGPATVVYRGSPTLRAVALTFDAGADPGFTGDILRTLREHGIRAAFGITGSWAEANRELLLAIAADGHEFINHTYSHRSFTGRSTATEPLTFEERSLELSRAETTVYRLTGRSTRPFFRPPFGDIDASVLADAGALGYHTVVMWTIDTLGWNGATRDQIVARAVDLAEPGAIVIMHVGSESQDAAALPDVITGLSDAGYAFVTVSELLAP